MMKSILTFALLSCFTTSVWASKSSLSATPDILVYTKVEKSWNIFLLKEFRSFMNNLNLEIDPYSYSVSTPLLYSEENIQKYVTESADELLHKVGKAIGLNYTSIKPELIINQFAYKFSKIEPVIKPIEDSDGNVTLKSDLKITGVEVFANDISLEFTIPGLSKKPTVRIVKPRVIVKDDFKLDFSLDVKLIEKKKDINLRLLNGNFSKITQALTENPDLIDIQFDRIDIPEIKMSFAGRELELNHDKIITIIEESTPALKVILFEQIHELFKRNGANDLLATLDNIHFDRDYWIESSSENMFPMQLGVSDFSVPSEGILLTSLSGDFCTTRNYVDFKENCFSNRKTKVHKSTTTQKDLINSKNYIEKDLLKNEKIKFIGSISEEYVDKAIVTTIDFGIWDPILDEIGVAMGDKNVLIKFNEKGDTATVLLDVIYDAGKFLGKLIKERYIRFPVTLKAKVRAENILENGKYNSAIVFNIHDVVLDDDTLMYGNKELGFPSTIQNIRGIFGLRKKVIKIVKKELFDYTAPKDPNNFKKWKGVDLPPVFLPEIKDMNLEKMEMQSDSFGRLNLILKDNVLEYND